MPSTTRKESTLDLKKDNFRSPKNTAMMSISTLALSPPPWARGRIYIFIDCPSISGATGGIQPWTALNMRPNLGKIYPKYNENNREVILRVWWKPHSILHRAAFLGGQGDILRVILGTLFFSLFGKFKLEMQMPLFKTEQSEQKGNPWFDCQIENDNNVQLAFRFPNELALKKDRVIAKLYRLNRPGGLGSGEEREDHSEFERRLCLGTLGYIDLSHFTTQFATSIVI